MTLPEDVIRTAYERACRLEIAALKPGNVHLFADGHRMTAEHFLTSARVSSLPLGKTGSPVGRRIQEAVQATRTAVGTNTNLGIILLCAPLMRAAELPGQDLQDNLGAVLETLDLADAKTIFNAIALASPGGLGSVKEHDVREEPKVPVLEAMGVAAAWDRIARQYISRFADVFSIGRDALGEALSRREESMWPTVFVYLAFLAGFPDSHIARKHGPEIAEAVRIEAASIREKLTSTTNETNRISLLSLFDRQLKARGINPGTSADLTVACLLVHLLESRASRRDADWCSNCLF